MKLSIKDRLMMPTFYPQKANIVEQVLVRDIKNKVELSQEEIKKYKIKVEKNGNITWDKSEEVEIKFTKEELELLEGRVKVLDQDKLITQDLLGLCLKISK